MKILTLHCDFIRFKAVRKAIKDAESLSEEQKIQEIKECLVVMAAVEKDDEKNIPEAAKALIKNIEDIAKQVNAGNIVLYPYAHLSSKLASPKTAVRILKDAETGLKKNFSVVRAPFGWYKQFEVKCKGHPLSELSREISVMAESKKERKKGTEFCKFILVDKEGGEYAVTKDNWQKSPLWENEGKEYKRLYTFVGNELGKSQEKEKPKHITYMRKLELVDYCPEADIGHYKWYPKGMLIKDLILDYQEKLAREFGAFKIQNPLIYRLSVPAIKELLGEFHEKDYSWQEGKENLILRFASDPGAFPFMQKIHFSHKNMPIKEFEEAICFRKEQKGEVKGLRRVRNFLMTDMHVFCSDQKQLKEQFIELCLICKKLMNGVIAKGRWVLGWEGTLDFYNKNKSWLIEIGKGMQVPAFFKLMRERNHYYDMKNEFQAIESDGGNIQISTVQIDSVNGERFDICYTDEKGEKKPCLIIHCSTFGSVERTLCAILENGAIDEQEGKKPTLPLWLCPTQVRIIPISKNYVTEALDIAKDLNEKQKIRADVDDRDLHVGKKILEAEQEWIPNIICLGKRELEKGILSLRIRSTGEIKELKPHVFRDMMKEATADMPFRALPLPILLSKRPRFV